MIVNYKRMEGGEWALGRRKRGKVFERRKKSLRPDREVTGDAIRRKKKKRNGIGMLRARELDRRTCIYRKINKVYRKYRQPDG